jgi:hypothetical protein
MDGIFQSSNHVLVVRLKKEDSIPVIPSSRAVDQCVLIILNHFDTSTLESGHAQSMICYSMFVKVCNLFHMALKHNTTIQI